MSYRQTSAQLDADVASTIQGWTNQYTNEQRVYQGADGSLHMYEQDTEDHTNILYMLYPNSHKDSQGYPYPGEYEPYSTLVFDESTAPSDDAAADPVKTRKKYARRKKIDETTTATEGGSRSAGAGPSSTPKAPKAPTRTSPRKPRTTSGKPTSSSQA